MRLFSLQSSSRDPKAMSLAIHNADQQYQAPYRLFSLQGSAKGLISPSWARVVNESTSHVLATVARGCAGSSTHRCPYWMLKQSTLTSALCRRVLIALLYIRAMEAVKPSNEP